MAGKVKPLAVKPEPVAANAEIATLVPPELVRVSVREALLPEATLPKLRLVGVDVSAPEINPEPDVGKVMVKLPPAYRRSWNANKTLPLLVPTDCGVNATVPLMLLPAFKVTG